MTYTLITIKDAIAELEQAIADKQKEIDGFDKSEYVSYDQYDDMLDEYSDFVTFGGLGYEPSFVLKRVDEVAYNIGYNDYVDSIDESDILEYQELESELEALQEDLEALEDEEQAMLDEPESED